MGKLDFEFDDRSDEMRMGLWLITKFKKRGKVVRWGIRSIAQSQAQMSIYRTSEEVSEHMRKDKI